MMRWLYGTRFGRVLGFLGLGMMAGTSNAAPYGVGDVVEDFTLYARRPVTNANGTVTPAGQPVRLSDFAGSIIFIEFFYIW